MSKASNVIWHEGEVARTERAGLLKQKCGCTLWFTGLSGSGKSTIAVELERQLHKIGYLCYRLDGDNVRLGINNNLGFSAEDRHENIRRVAEIARLFVDTGMIVLSSFISPYRADRDMVRTLHKDGEMEFLEVYVDCPLEVAEDRDPKGLYKKARSGEIPLFTGISDPYEAPENPDIHLQTHQLTVEEETQILIKALRERNIL